MNKTRTVSIILIAACLLVSGVALAGKNPATYTCAELLEVDIDYVPQGIYWLDGYNWAGDPVFDADVEWVPDGNQREQPQRRKELFERFRSTLAELGARVAHIRGSWEERTRKALETVDRFLKG